METKLKSQRFDNIKQWLGFSNCFVVDPVGRKEGLAILWRDNVQLDIHNFSLMLISAWVEDTFTKIKWLFFKFYGEPTSSKKHYTWELLDAMKSTKLIAWMVDGDFNEIIFQLEKHGGQ